MGDEQAESYLRLLAEVELRRAGAQLRGLDAAIRPDDWSDPGMAPFAAAEGAQWKVIRAGRILVVAGALEEDFLVRLAAAAGGCGSRPSGGRCGWPASAGCRRCT